MHYIYSKNLNTQTSTLVIGMMLLLVALIFIDDIDLCIFNLGSDNTEEIVVRA